MIAIKWVLMIIGAVMVVAVFYLTGNVINEGLNGAFRKNRTMIEKSLANNNLTLTEVGKDL
jgi:hypothetical protein